MFSLLRGLGLAFASGEIVDMYIFFILVLQNYYF